ncbi:unnamed protein product [Staurois parvus]|uniref:Uncharacterized protein n=1 Tax=Staurois parvus TaxID=386267 RepID=A0ABN9H6Q6_9NEOB|nr:unnamed protein product [Staurois parvus]
MEDVQHQLAPFSSQTYCPLPAPFIHLIFCSFNYCITYGCYQGRTDNSWGPRAIGDHGAPVSLPKLKKAYEKGTRGISWGPLLTLGPRAVPVFPNGQSTPG